MKSSANYKQFKAISARLIFLILIAASSIIVIVLVQNARLSDFISENSELAEIINISGRQRMLSQNLSKNAILGLTSDSASSKRNEKIDSLLTIFKTSHVLLQQQNKKLFSDEDEHSLDSLFEAIAPSYKSFVDLLDQSIKKTSDDPELLNEILKNGNYFLPLKDQITNEYERLAEKTLSKINSNVSNANFTVAVVIVFVAIIVLIVMLRIIRGYADRLDHQSEELIRVNDRLENFFQSTSDLIYELDGESKYLYVNKTVENLLGYSMSELRKKSCWDFVPDPYLESTRNYYIDHVRQKKKSSYYEFPILNKSGEMIWLGQSVDYSYEGGRAIHAYVIAKDITQVKKSEQEQEKYREGLHLLNDLGSRNTDELAVLLSDGLKLCAEFLKLDLGIVSSIKSENYTIVEFYPSKAGLEIGQRFELGGTYCDITLKADKPISIDEMSSSEYNSHPCFENFKLESYLGAAYSVKGKVRGTINFTSANARKEPFTEYDLDFIKLVARWVGSTIAKDEETKKIEEEQSILEAFVSSAPASIAMMDKEVKYLAASEKWLKDYSINQEVIGKSHYDIFPEIGDDWKELHQRAINGETLSCAEDPFERADGGIQWIKWEVKPWYRLDKEIGGFIMLTEDVTHARQQRENLLVAKEDQDNLVAIIAHDLKAPFGQIVGLSDLISSEINEEGEVINKMIKKISSDSLNMIEDLVQLKYWEKSGAELSLSEFNLQSFHETKMKSFLERAENKKIALRGSTSIAKDLIKSDEGLFGRIVDNLLSNAIKFSPKNGMVSFHLSSKENSVELTIEDNGEGFSKSDKEKAFQKFQRLSTQPTGGESSSGLGLSIVHTLVEQLGGTITLESEKGKGAKFKVVLPMSS